MNRTRDERPGWECAPTLVAVFLVACSGSATSAEAPASDAGSDGSFDSSDARVGDASLPPDAGGKTDAGAPTDAAAAPEDGGHGNPLTELAACLGPSKPLTLSGQMPYLSVPVGSQAGDFVLDFGSNFSSIDLSAFAPPGPSTSGCNASLLGVVCTVAGFAFFGPPASVQLTTENYSGVGGAVRQAGIVGTDFLSEDVITLAYAAGLVFASPSTGFCSDTALRAAGFAPLTTAGFYENDLTKLEALSLVDSSGPANDTVPDIPTVPVSVAGANALAQLDTGFDDDLTPFSVNINQAFYAEITAAAPSALVRDPSLDTTLTTCVSGVSQSVTGYRLAASTTFDFLTDGGAVARSYASTAIFVKSAPAAAQGCGGISTWTVPAAQVAASYFNEMQIVLFDPYSSRVWIPQQ
jgi:hypothetical protein